jgi:hypothetical protein
MLNRSSQFATTLARERGKSRDAGLVRLGTLWNACGSKSAIRSLYLNEREPCAKSLLANENISDSRQPLEFVHLCSTQSAALQACEVHAIEMSDSPAS